MPSTRDARLGEAQPSSPQVLVIGTGAAGLTAALQLLDGGVRVVLMDKAERLGGNSVRASSGISASAGPHTGGDARARAARVQAFARDAAASARRPQEGHIGVLAGGSEAAVEWLVDRTGLDLSQVSQLGGHSVARTFRPKAGPIGAALIDALKREVLSYRDKGSLTLLTGCRAVSLLTDAQGAVVGVRYRHNLDETGEEKSVLAAHTVLATGGFASSAEMLGVYRPELVGVPSSNGPTATGDGIRMAVQAGAGVVDMSEVQVHPTGFVDVGAGASGHRVLCGEAVRGAGALVLTHEGHRFTDELAPRDMVVEAMRTHGPAPFVLVVSEAAARAAEAHVRFYTSKGLLTHLHGVHQLAQWIVDTRRTARARDAGALGGGGSDVDASVLAGRLRGTYEAYMAAAAAGEDRFGKRRFPGLPYEPNGSVLAGWVTPVVHYTMGGIATDTRGGVLTPDGRPVPHLHAAGEVTGGVHGHNRLAGNSLLECVVFGKAIAHTLAEAGAPAEGAGAAGRWERRELRG